MAVSFTKSATFVKDGRFTKPWQAERFLLQSGYYFHGAVIEYVNPTTGYKTGVAFTKGGTATIFQDPDTGDFFPARKVMTILKKVYEENKPLIAEGGFPEGFLTDYEGAIEIFQSCIAEDFFDANTFADYFTQEDIQDIKDRLTELQVFDEEEIIEG